MAMMDTFVSLESEMMGSVGDGRDDGEDGADRLDAHNAGESAYAPTLQLKCRDSPVSFGRAIHTLQKSSLRNYTVRKPWAGRSYLFLQSPPHPKYHLALHPIPACNAPFNPAPAVIPNPVVQTVEFNENVVDPRVLRS